MLDTEVELQGYDKEQIDMMDENCIIVDNEDNIIGKEGEGFILGKKVKSDVEKGTPVRWSLIKK